MVGHIRRLLAVGLLAIAVLAAACGASDRGNGLPDSIGDEERDEISDVLENWIGALNRSELGGASAYTLTPGEVGPTPRQGTTAYQRLSVEVGAYTAERLEYEFQRVRSVTVADGRAAVTFETNFGPREAEMVVRDGKWKISRLPRMLVPSAEGPVNITTRVLRVIERSTYERTWLVEFTNESDVPALWNSGWALVFDEDGNENSVSSSALAIQPFLWPGEATLVRIDGVLDGGRTAAPAEIVPIFRRAFESDRRPVVDVSATGVALTTEGLADRMVVTGTVANPALEAIRVDVICGAVRGWRRTARSGAVARERYGSSSGRERGRLGRGLLQSAGRWRRERGPVRTCHIASATVALTSSYRRRSVKCRGFSRRERRCVSATDIWSGVPLERR